MRAWALILLLVVLVSCNPSGKAVYQGVQKYVIVDNTDSTSEGTWKSADAIGVYGKDYYYSIGSSWFEWKAENLQGTYDVYARWVSKGGFPVSYIIYHDNGETTVEKDQTSRGGQWNLIGRYYFTGTGTVKLIGPGTADAIMFQRRG